MQHTHTLENDTKLLIGASWYPEMWPEAEWPKDVARMRELGFNVVRVFEFAWHRFEPREGEFDFAWARRVMDLCDAAGIAVMIGTPTAAPPAWLTTKYPEVLITHPDGRRVTHGQRKHGSMYSDKYRELCAKVVSAMVDALGDHPALHSWQIDNELGAHDYGPEAKAKFRRWLRAKYGTIENLNRTWGLEFWSQAYDDFSQIPMPLASVGSIEIPERHHPSLIMAVAQHYNDEVYQYIKTQVDMIRAKSDKPITTNMTAGLGTNYFQQNTLMDRTAWSVYADLKHYPWVCARYDRSRGEKRVTGYRGNGVTGSGAATPLPRHPDTPLPPPYRPFWLLETAPNWSGGGKQWNIHNHAAGVRTASWLSTMLGGSAVVYWQWREHWAGQEMQHGTHVTATGKWRPNKAAWTQIAQEFATHGEWLLAHPPASAPIGLMLSAEAAWAFSIDPIDENMRYEERWREDYYLPLLRQHLWRDVIAEAQDFSPYRILLMPMMPVIKNETRRRLREWVEGGGLLLVGPLSGYRTEEFTAFTDREFGGLEDFIGAESSLRFTVHWVEDQTSVQFADGSICRTRNWCEGFTTTSGKALASYRGGYGDGHVAAVYNRVGKGAVLTLGCQVPADVYVGLVQRLAREAGVTPVATGSQQVLVVPRAAADGRVAGYALLNLAEQAQTITLPAGGTDRFSGKQVGPEIEIGPLGVMLVEMS